jgi:opacity protein-like surface antigen
MFKKIAIVATLSLLASSSFAAAPIYAGADFGSTKIDDASDRSSSYGAFIGYKFHENFAIEGSFRRLGDFDFAVGTASANAKIDQTALSVIGSLPLASGFNLYARLGYNQLKVKASIGGSSGDDSTSGGLYGVGVGYTFSPTVSARLEVQKPSSDSTNVHAGVVFNF